MTRVLSIAAALAASVMMLAPVASSAQGLDGYYTATPVAQPTKTSFITSNLMWKWRDTAFTANKAPARDNIVCQMIVQRAGALSAFTAGGQAFDADALAKCNARAK
ncbi:MAG: hypothetical protein P0Y59_20010 [Candidatus Sphingomonas phytovorans]|nr:hypothetical protein [Sphingomonas sp.]WEJ99199.1 MAG: hypothetical protein P0Y59_20010 [Sphingomonas sp.]